MIITKTKFSYTTNKTNLKFIHVNNKTMRIYYKNNKTKKDIKNISFIEFINNIYIYKELNSQTEREIQNKEELYLFLDNLIENHIIFFKNTEIIFNLDFINIPRSNHLFEYKNHRIIGMEEFFFLEEGNLNYINNIKQFYLDSVNTLNLKNLSKYSSIFDYVINNGLKKIVNKISFLNKDLDLNFLETIQHGWGENFKLLENRNDRNIVAIDINSMFPFCMTQENFTEINKMLLIKDLDKQNEINYLDLVLNGEINNGISVVEMKIKTTLNKEENDFIENYNFFLINKLGNKYSFNGFKDKTIQTYIHNSEIQVLNKYFDFTIKEMVYSKKSISHYLSETINKFYDYRINEEDPNIKKIIKTMLVAYHSVTNKNIMKKETKIFESKQKAVHYFKNYLKYSVINDYGKFFLYKNKNLEGLYIEEVEEIGKKIHITYRIPMTGKTTQIYSLPSQIMSNSRCHIFKIIEKINLDFNIKNPEAKAEVCYTNIDSLHISIKKEYINTFKEFFKEDLENNVLGKFKIEGIFDSGLWFDPGRYWLFNKETPKHYSVKQFKSIVFKSENPWTVFKKIPMLDKYGSLIERGHYLFTSTNYNKLFYKRNETNIILKKFSLDKIIQEDFILFIERLIMKNYPIKKNSFEYFKKRDIKIKKL